MNFEKAGKKLVLLLALVNIVRPIVDSKTKFAIVQFATSTKNPYLQLEAKTCPYGFHMVISDDLKICYVDKLACVSYDDESQSCRMCSPGWLFNLIGEDGARYCQMKIHWILFFIILLVSGIVMIWWGFKKIKMIKEEALMQYHPELVAAENENDPMTGPVADANVIFSKSDKIRVMLKKVRKQM